MKAGCCHLRAIVSFVISAHIAPLHAGNDDYIAPLHAPAATTISVDEAKWLHHEGTVFIDVRNPRLFARRHIPGAHHIDMKDGFTRETLAAVATKEQPIVIYSSGIKCNKVHKASEFAAAWGYQKIYYFRGGIVDWRDVGFPLETTSN